MKKFFLSLLLCVFAMAVKAQKTAMLKLSNPSSTEQAALSWFEDNAGGEVISADALTLQSLDNISCLWIMVDRVGLEIGAENLPDNLNTLATTVLKPFVQAGGCLLLTNQATQLTYAMGRTSYAPKLYGNGSGGQNADEWGIQAVIGNVDGQTYDHRSHDIFKGLEENDKYGHPTYALIGSGLKLDHNCMWDLNLGEYGLADNPNKVADFEDKNNAVVLGTWQHVVDYCCAGIVEFLPTDEFEGTVLACGLAAYDWTQWQYSPNFTKLTANMITYLSKKSTSTAISSVSVADDKPEELYNLAGQRVSDKAKGIVISKGKKKILK